MLFADLPNISRPERWRDIDGVVLLDKPVGLTSNQALQLIRRLLGASKGGHTGTLDPFATGVLPICLGEATKFSADLLNADKSYLATICFGSQTDTGDLTGAVIKTTEKLPTVDQMDNVLPKFMGESEQIPPMYSALKRNGQPLYKLARAGLEVERQPRKIQLLELSWAEIKANERGYVTQAQLLVRCSKGTYIRTLAEDISVQMGTLGHLIALRRTSVGNVSLAGCRMIGEMVNEVELLQKGSELPSNEQLLHANVLHPTDFLVQNLPILSLTIQQHQLCLNGNPFALNEEQKVVAEEMLRIYFSKQFLGLARVIKSPEAEKIQPVRLISNQNS